VGDILFQTHATLRRVLYLCQVQLPSVIVLRQQIMKIIPSGGPATMYEVMEQFQRGEEYWVEHNWGPIYRDVAKTHLLPAEEDGDGDCGGGGGGGGSDVGGGGDEKGEKVKEKKRGLPEFCSVCHLEARLRCTNCIKYNREHVAHYCCKEHQAEDWADHKKECKKPTPPRRQAYY
jgi:hypothetical protein